MDIKNIDKQILIGILADNPGWMVKMDGPCAVLDREPKYVAVFEWSCDPETALRVEGFDTAQECQSFIDEMKARPLTGENLWGLVFGQNLNHSEHDKL